MVKEIITDFDKMRDRADEVDLRKEGAKVREIILDLKDTIRKNNLVYLTAPQIGYNVRVFCINYSGDIHTFVNPIVATAKTLQMSIETCKSIPDKRFMIPRANDVLAMYETPLCKVETKKLTGLSAFIYQHCMEHLDGIAISDIGLEIDELYDKASDEEKGELIKRYIDALGIKQKNIEEEINKDKNLKEASDAMKFAEEVAKGNVTLEGIEKRSDNTDNGNKNQTEEEDKC